MATDPNSKFQIPSKQTRNPVTEFRIPKANQTETVHARPGKVERELSAPTKAEGANRYGSTPRKSHKCGTVGEPIEVWEAAGVSGYL